MLFCTDRDGLKKCRKLSKTFKNGIILYQTMIYQGIYMYLIKKTYNVQENCKNLKGHYKIKKKLK